MIIDAHAHLWKTQKGKVDGKVACECDCTFAIMDPKKN